MILIDMKINTQKLLLLLISDKKWAVSYDHLEYLWPELSPSGRRSLVFHLVKTRLLEEQQNYLPGGRVTFQLTELGRRAAVRAFPSLSGVSEDLASPQQGWCLLLLEAPTEDPSFVKLKKKLAKIGVLRANPKAYVFQTQPSVEIHEFLEKGYFYNVALFEMGKWQVGELRQLVQESTDLKAALYALSGISREVDRLILKEIGYFVPNHQSNSELFSVFERFFFVLHPFYRSFPQDKVFSLSCKELLEKLQSLIFPS
jgi:hypothetical protein